MAGDISTISAPLCRDVPEDMLNSTFLLVALDTDDDDIDWMRLHHHYVTTDK